MLLAVDAIDWREKSSRMCMYVQGRLMQALFVEIHQVFAIKESDTFLTERCNQSKVSENVCRTREGVLQIAT